MDPNGSPESDSSIRAFVRIRPPLARELETGFKPCLTVDSEHNVVVAQTTPKSQAFQYDFVAGMDTSQEEIFDKVGRPVTHMCVDGYNATICAYGQTGSGKTYTIQGGDAAQIANQYRTSRDHRGLMPRVFKYLFELIERAEVASGRTVKFLCQASFLEIYNDKIYDLMLASSDVLPLREHIEQGVYVEGLVEVPVNSAADALRVLDIGAQNRTVGETAMNRESSRSHSVFMLTITSSRTDRETGLTTNRTSHFNLVDLAGSERQRDAQTSGQRLAEASGINQSLSALGNVILSLVDLSHGKQRHVPYRDSKLTFLLKDSLGGNSLTYVVACVSPHHDSLGETVSTLKFAQRAKRIKNRAILNESVGGTLDALKKENARLRAALQQLQQAGGGVAVERLIDSISKQSQAELKAIESGVTASTVENSDVVVFDVALFRQALSREQRVREELDKLQTELDKVQQLNSALEKQKQSSRMILSFRDRTIQELQNSVAKLRKKEGSPIMEYEKAMKQQVSRLTEEVKEVLLAGDTVT